MLRVLRNNKAFGLLEIVIAAGIIGATVLALITVFLLGSATVEASRQKIQAVFILDEGLEVLRFFRDGNWSGTLGTLSSGTDYYLSFSTSTSLWAISASPSQAIDGVFTRSFKVENVSRDASSNIESSYDPSRNDPGTKKIVMKVVWSSRGQNQTLTVENYFVNLFRN